MNAKILYDVSPEIETRILPGIYDGLPDGESAFGIITEAQTENYTYFLVQIELGGRFRRIRKRNPIPLSVLERMEEERTRRERERELAKINEDDTAGLPAEHRPLISERTYAIFRKLAGHLNDTMKKIFAGVRHTDEIAIKRY